MHQVFRITQEVDRILEAKEGKIQEAKVAEQVDQEVSIQMSSIYPNMVKAA